MGVMGLPIITAFYLFVLLRMSTRMFSVSTFSQAVVLFYPRSPKGGGFRACGLLCFVHIFDGFLYKAPPAPA